MGVCAQQNCEGVAGCIGRQVNNTLGRTHTIESPGHHTARDRNQPALRQVQNFQFSHVLRVPKLFRDKSLHHHRRMRV